MKLPITKAIIVGITQPNPTLAKGIKFNVVPNTANKKPNTNEV